MQCSRGGSKNLKREGSSEIFFKKKGGGGGGVWTPTPAWICPWTAPVRHITDNLGTRVSGVDPEFSKVGGGGGGGGPGGLW